MCILHIFGRKVMIHSADEKGYDYEIKYKARQAYSLVDRESIWPRKKSMRNN